MSQFLNTLQQIVHCDSVEPFHGICRHLYWQVRKTLHRFPCELAIASSRLHVDRPGGVAALVNAMGEYDYNNMRFLKLVLSVERGTFIDIGANIGVYTLIASEVVNARVVSIEPHPATFALLKENVRLNDRHNVACLNIALSYCDGELQFTDYQERAVNRVVSARENGGSELRVASRRFDALCRELGVVPDFVKIDVEGHECAVLEGFRDFRAATKIIFIEGGERQEVRNWMKTAGYTGPWFVHFNDKVLSTGRQRRAEDPLFVHTNYVPELSNINFDFLDPRAEMRISKA
jgi:FkbM family methyltransferase